MPWDVNGNAITGTNFLGTTNFEPLVMKTNKNEAMRVRTDGSVGIGTTGPIGQLGVVVGDGGIGVQGESSGTDQGGSGGIGVYGHCPPDWLWPGVHSILAAEELASRKLNYRDR